MAKSVLNKLYLWGSHFALIKLVCPNSKGKIAAFSAPRLITLNVSILRLIFRNNLKAEKLQRANSQCWNFIRFPLHINVNSHYYISHWAKTATTTKLTAYFRASGRKFLSRIIPRGDLMEKYDSYDILRRLRYFDDLLLDVWDDRSIISKSFYQKYGFLD